MSCWCPPAPPPVASFRSPRMTSKSTQLNMTNYGDVVGGMYSELQSLPWIPLLTLLWWGCCPLWITIPSVHSCSSSLWSRRDLQWFHQLQAQHSSKVSIYDLPSHTCTCHHWSRSWRLQKHILHLPVHFCCRWDCTCSRNPTHLPSNTLQAGSLL
jgi:hypothetical protein